MHCVAFLALLGFWWEYQQSASHYLQRAHCSLYFAFHLFFLCKHHHSWAVFRFLPTQTINKVNCHGTTTCSYLSSASKLVFSALHISLSPIYQIKAFHRPVNHTTSHKYWPQTPHSDYIHSIAYAVYASPNWKERSICICSFIATITPNIRTIHTHPVRNQHRLSSIQQFAAFHSLSMWSLLHNKLSQVYSVCKLFPLKL